MEKAEFALLVVQPVGQNVTRLAQLAAEYPDIEVAAVVDNLASLAAIANAAEQHHVVITLCLDIDNGMGRTGIRCGALAKKIYQQIVNYRSLIRGGLHVYDGHIHELDPAVRQQSVDAAMECVSAFRDDLVAGGDDVPRLIVGGTPSFPIHAAHANRICSPGTPVFWDANYGERFPDLEFLPAAVLLTRVISKLSQKQVCVDLGYKAIAAEMAPPRANFLNVDVVSEKIHSEEHLVIEIAPNCDLEVGDLLYVLPRHICPTVALHQKMLVVEDGMIVDQWPVTARDRSISI